MKKLYKDCVLLILIILFFGSIVYTSYRYAKFGIGLETPCEKVQVYYAVGNFGNQYRLTSNLEESRKLSPNNLIVTREECLN